MNIESLLSKIQLFKELIIDSGFNRDLKDYNQAIQQGQNQNLVYLKNISSMVKEKFTECENYGLDKELSYILKDSLPFTSLEIIEELNEIDADSEIDANIYFNKLTSVLSKLIQRIDANNNELDGVTEIFKKYITVDDDYETQGNQAVMSLIFRDLKSTGSLKEFSKVLNRWNTTLLIYHTLLKSDSPKEISLVEIQNGSIDVIFNIDFDVAIDLAELITLGLKVYGAYLIYKTKLAKELIDSYKGNKKLIEMEEVRQQIMLDNIKESVERKIIEQHNEKLANDDKISTTSSSKKANQVAKVITDHIIKGNEVKLLTTIEEEEGEDDAGSDLSSELREQTAFVREQFKKINSVDQQLLIETYSIEDLDDTVPSPKNVAKP